MDDFILMESWVSLWKEPVERYSFTVNDLNKDSVDELVAAGAKPLPTAKEVAAVSDVIITMLPKSPHVKEVVLGKGGVIEGAKPNSIVVDMSSISPIVSREVSAELAKKRSSCRCSVSGGAKAIDGSLPSGGGSKASQSRNSCVMGGMSPGSEMVVKITSCKQSWFASNIAGMSEALVLATKANVDPEKVFKAIRGGLAGSTVLDAKAPLVLAGNFKPGFRIDLHIKDLQNALDTAQSVGTPSPISEAAIEMMKSLSLEGKGSDDHGGLIQWYEKQAKVEVRS